jgi:hypothetical protein
MTPALGDLDAVAPDSVHKAVCFIDPSAPPTEEIPLQRLWLPQSFILIAIYVLQKLIDAFYRLFVLRLPVQIIFPCGLFENEVTHSP